MPAFGFNRRFKRWAGTRPIQFRRFLTLEYINQKPAVANAIAINPVGYLIPCHRVIAKLGKIDRYRWGTTGKKVILRWEAVESGKK